jgi:Na+/H+-dicarboxylate symporter
MKTWIIYLVATLMGLATTLLLGQFPAYGTFIQSASNVLIQFGGFILFPIVFFTFASGIASLRKDKMGGRVASSTIIWTILPTLLLTILGSLFFVLLPTKFPASSSAGAGTSAVLEFIRTTLEYTKSSLNPVNPFYTLASSQGMILPICIISFILGYFLKPNSDIIRPAYVTMNSFSEVMYRISSAFAIYGFAFVYIIVASFFMQLQTDASIFVSPRFVFTILLLANISLFGILPLIYGLLTGFKSNPYRILYRTLGAQISAFFSGSILFSTPMLYSLTRNNLGIQKRIASTTIPITSMFAKGGSAMISVFTILSLIYSATGGLPEVSIIIFIILCSFFVSLISSVFLGFGVFFITYVTMKIVGIDLANAEMSLVGILPLLSGLGAILDSYISTLCTASTSFWLETEVDVPYEDIL